MNEIETELKYIDGAPAVSSAVRVINEHHTQHEVRIAVDTALALVRNILLNPRDIKKYRVKRSNPTFYGNIGRLSGGDLLMKSIGFTSPTSDDGATLGPVFVLQSLDPITVTTPNNANAKNEFDTVTAKFSFPSLGDTTATFLWRRKADLETMLRSIDMNDEDVMKKSSSSKTGSITDDKSSKSKQISNQR